MSRGELTDEEAFFVLRYAGRMGYRRAIKRLSPGYPWQQWREKVVWFGGWESSELTQWDRGAPAWRIRSRCEYTGKVRWHDPFPLRLFNRLTFFGWGWQLRIRRGYLCFSKTYAYEAFPDKLFWSPDGTPQNPRARFFWRKRRPTKLAAAERND
jgi:hypothetical protein